MSFRQWLLIAFLLVAVLLGGAAVRTLFALADLMARDRANAALAIDLSAATQALARHSHAMERAVRQSLVLGDAELGRRFESAAAEAEAILGRLTAAALPSAQADEWRRRLAVIAALADGPPQTELERERRVAAAFRELDGLNAAIGQAVQQNIAHRNEVLAVELDARRETLARQVLAAVALAAVLALGFGFWLARPFLRLESAIIGLGENRLDRPIAIRGPSDVRRLGRQLDWLRLRLSELDADKARFLRHVSHELKTPLATLREGISLLEDEVAGALAPRQRNVVEILQNNVAAMQERIEALLRFNAAAFDARRLDRRATELRPLLERQVEAHRLQWQARGVAVEVVGDAPPVVMDAEKVGAAFANLLANAIRFSPPGGTVRVALDVAERVRIDVVDQGPGVAPEDRERIFEPFYRGVRQPDGPLPGTGIGLSIVLEYIAAHGGRVELLPASAGACFRIELPRDLPDEV